MSRLFSKILFTFWLTLLLSSVLAGVSVWLHQSKMEELRKDIVIHPDSVLAIQSAANTYHFAGMEALESLLLELQKHAPPSHQVYALREDGSELLSRPISASTLARVQQVGDEEMHPPLIKKTFFQNTPITLFIPAIGQRNSKGLPHLPPPPPFSGLYLIIAGIILSLLSSIGLTWYLLRPIRHLQKAFKDISKGDLSRRVSAKFGRRKDELADLGNEFDAMANNLQNLQAAQTQLLHNISHELRSPLARMQVALGLIEQQPNNAPSYNLRIEKEIDRLDLLIDEIFTLSRLKSGSHFGQDEMFELNGCISSVIMDAELEASYLRKNIDYKSLTQEECWVNGQQQLFYRALDNVIRNAIYHTPENTSILVQSFKEMDNKDQASMRIIIEDSGEGIAKEHIKHLFEPFYHIPSSKTVKNKGHGLGLTIAKQAIEYHHGSILVENRTDISHGLRIFIKIPILISKEAKLTAYGG